MYLFYMMNNGYIPMGNDGQLVIPHNIARNVARINRFAREWLGNRPGRVYLMRSWTQAMCEMAPAQFETYIAKNGILVAQR